MSSNITNILAGLLAPVLAFAATPGAVRADSVQAMRTSLELIAGKDWDGALRVAPSGVGRDLVEWHRLRAGEGLLGDYERFLQKRADWPGLALLREKGEEAAARSTTPDRVIAYFGSNSPKTAQGAIALVQALQAVGRVAEAEEVAMKAWADLSFDPEQERAMIGLAGASVALVHEHRLDVLLWRGEQAEAERMMDRVSADWKALARARLALRHDLNGVDAAISALPAGLSADPGLAYERFIWRMRRDRYDEALPLILAQSASTASLGDPEAWAPRRAILARWLMRQGRAAEAYKVAAPHQLGAGSSYAELEFLSGFIALRRLQEPARALEHFKHLESGVSTPISLGRALYWQGRALEAMGNGDAATEAYRRAAVHQTAYYGLLAAERLGQSLDPVLLGGALPSDWRSAGWTGSSVHQAAELALQAGDRNLAKRFWLHLAERQDATGLAQMGAMALARNEPHIAVLIGKAAAERGIILPEAYFPVTEIVPDGLSVSRAFAMAIARRESEFDPAARSTADARGLMQVLPETAKMMAKRLSLPFDAARLTRDPAYNAQLGSAYLAQLVEEFGPSVALVAAGYNAGPGRPRQWIKEFGDPRRPDVDVVDWVESIPFGETRTYVMRVVEGIVIYRAKLRGSVGPVRLTSELKG